MIIDGGSLDWHIINPDILGSMLQAVVSPEERDEDQNYEENDKKQLKVKLPIS